MKRLLLIALPLLLCLPLRAQDTLRMAPVADSVADAGVGEWGNATPVVAAPLSHAATLASPVPDTVYILRTDTLRLYRTDTLHIYHTDTVVRREADTAALKALQEKEVFYREILSANGVDKEKLEAERNYYIHMVDSLRTIVRIAELENVRKEEANKYLAERAKAAEERVALATNRKKKVRPIQGVAMRFYRTPDWEIRLKAGPTAGTYDRYISNRNAGDIEFDYVTGASVMLWDLTKYFNQKHTLGPDSTSMQIRRFDQDFAYDTDTRFLLIRDRKIIKIMNDASAELIELCRHRSFAREELRALGIPFLIHGIGRALLPLIRSHSVETLHQHVTQNERVNRFGEERQCELKARLLLKTAHVDGYDRNLSHISLLKSSPDKTDIVGGTAPAAGLSYDDSDLIKIVLA